MAGGMRRYRRTGVLALAILSAALPGHGEAVKKSSPPKHASATSPTKLLGTVDAWSAYVYREHSGPVCYLAGNPKKSEPANAKRKQPTMMVTHRPAENVANVVSFVEGAALKEGSDASLDVDGTKFDLFTKTDTAWSRTSDLDKTIVEAMAKAKQAVFKATPQKGPATTDTYPLAGFARTLALIDKACGIKR